MRGAQGECRDFAQVRCALMFAFVSAPVDMPPSLGSLANNQLCGVSPWGGTYTTEGITQLCEALKGSAVTSLECATTPYTVFAFVSAPLDKLALSLSLLRPSPAVSAATTSETRAPPRLLPSSKRRESPSSSAPQPLVFAFASVPINVD